MTELDRITPIDELRVMRPSRLLWVGYSSQIAAHRDTCSQVRANGLCTTVEVVGRARDIAHGDHVHLVCDYSSAIRAEYGAPRGREFAADLEIAYKPYQYETFRMMDRLLGRSGSYRLSVSLDARRKMLLRHLSFWGHYLDSRSGDLAIVFVAVPHEVFTFVLYNLAQIRAVPSLLVTPEKSAKVEHDWLSQRRPTHRQSSINTSTFFVAESLGDIGRWQLASDLARDKQGRAYLRPSTYFFDSQMSPILQSLTQRVNDRSKLTPQRLSPARVLHRSRSEIQRLSWRWHARSHHNPTKILLFLLAFQPEESTSPRAGEFVDQELAIDAIRAALPASWILRVREHPHQFLRHRPRPHGYYRQLAMRRGVELIPVSETPSESLQGADVVAAAGGSLSIAAWKAAKPLLLLGHTLLKQAPGVRYASNSSCVPERLHELLAAPHAEFSQSARMLFDQWTASHAFRGDPGLGSLYRDQHPDVTSQNLSCLIITWLEGLNRRSAA